MTDYHRWADDEMQAAGLFHGLAMHHENHGNPDRARYLRGVAEECARRAEWWLRLAAREELARGTAEVGRG